MKCTHTQVLFSLTRWSKPHIKWFFQSEYKKDWHVSVSGEKSACLMHCMPQIIENNCYALLSIEELTLRYCYLYYCLLNNLSQLYSGMLHTLKAAWHRLFIIANCYFSSAPHLGLFWSHCSVTSSEQRRGLLALELRLSSPTAQRLRFPCVNLLSPSGKAGILAVGCGQLELRELWQPAARPATASTATKKKHWSIRAPLGGEEHCNNTGLTCPKTMKVKDIINEHKYMLSLALQPNDLENTTYRLSSHLIFIQRLRQSEGARKLLVRGLDGRFLGSCNHHFSSKDHPSIRPKTASYTYSLPCMTEVK